MNKDTLKALVRDKIAGQGNQIDSGGALATILDEIIDAVAANTEAIGEIPAPVPQVQSDWNQSDDAEVDFIKNKPTLVKPIVITDEPSGDMTTQAELDAIGLTFDEIKAASEGKRNCVVWGGSVYAITRCDVEQGGNYRFAFYESIYNASGQLAGMGGYSIERGSDTVISVVVTEY